MFDPAEYGQWFNIVAESYTVTAGSPVQVAKGNPNRVAIYFTNGPSTAMYLGLQAALTLANANFVVPTDDTIKLIWSQDGVLCQQNFWALGAGSGTTLVVTELIWQPRRT